MLVGSGSIRSISCLIFMLSCHCSYLLPKQSRRNVRSSCGFASFLRAGVFSNFGITVSESLHSALHLEENRWYRNQEQQNYYKQRHHPSRAFSKSPRIPSSYFSAMDDDTRSRRDDDLNHCVSLAEFLKVQKEKFEDKSTFGHQNFHFSLGNPAGDADSIISAITIAYVDSILLQKNNSDIIPIVSIPQHSLRTQRPETMHLFRLAGIPVDSLVFLDHPHVQEALSCNNHCVTLVDHNSRDFSWRVTEIVDHHLDEYNHLNDSKGESRQIAFDVKTQKALVASTCTLIVERYLGKIRDDNPQPTELSSLAILLLGTIALDSVNMSPKAGKGTPRDASALQALLEETDWSDLKAKNEKDMSDENDAIVFFENGHPDVSALFDTLQYQKFNPSFWNQLSVMDALGLDYKSFTSPASEGTKPMTFGVSSVLQTMEDFFGFNDGESTSSPFLSPTVETEIADQIIQYMKDQEIPLLGIMFATKDKTSDSFVRKLVLCSTSAEWLEKLVEFLLQSPQGKTLQLERQYTTTTTVRTTVTNESDNENITASDDSSMRLVYFKQHNVAGSRKQVVPVLFEYWKQ